MNQYSGYKRSLEITITKRTNNIIDVGYPKTYPTSVDIANGYFIYNGIHYAIPSDDELAYMSDIDYTDLVGVFKLYVNFTEQISIDGTEINNNLEYDSNTCSGETPTTTTIEPTTTTLEPLPALDYDVRFVCTPSNSQVIIENYFGGSGVYEVGSNLYLSESEALSAITFNIGISPYIYLNVVDGIYWLVVRDANNINNKVVKMIEVICSSTTTLEPITISTTTLEPTTTIEPTTTEPPVYEGSCYNLHIPTASLSSGGQDLYILYRDINGNNITTPYYQFEDFGGYASGIDIMLCSIIQPLYRYGLSGNIFNFVYWIANQCTDCCNQNIDCEINKPPVALNQYIYVNRWIGVCLQAITPYPDLNWFRYSDYDDDAVNAIRIITLPQYGTLYTTNQWGYSTPVTAGQIIEYPYTNDVNQVWYYTSDINTNNYDDYFIFQVRTNNNTTWSNTGKTTFIVSTCVQPTTTAEPASCEIFVPDGFSPNGDNIHDYFDVFGLTCYPNHRMSIFDRAGNLLYRRTNDYPTHPWDGSVGGVIIHDITRTWILEINGSVHSTGSVFVG